MGILKRRMRVLASLQLLAFTAACGPTEITKTITFDTDTYMSSGDAADHSELTSLRISKSSLLEERGLIKFPTGSQDLDNNIDDAYEAFIAIFFMPLFILNGMLSCEAKVLQPENLTAAVLKLDVESDGGAVLTGKIRLRLLSKPWWHSAHWSRAHPFSGKGVWATAGGDIDATFSALDATDDGTSVSFDVKTYFQTLISNTSLPHYGFLLQTDDAALGEVKLKSTQVALATERPRLVTTYTGNCSSSTAVRVDSTYIMGETGHGSAQVTPVP